jgi:DDE domain
VDELLPAAWHRTDRYANNRVECDYGRLKARLQPMRGLEQDRSARVVIAGHALVQNLRRGHYELAVEEAVGRRLAVAFEELAMAICRRRRSFSMPCVGAMQHSRLAY